MVVRSLVTVVSIVVILLFTSLEGKFIVSSVDGQYVYVAYGGSMFSSEDFGRSPWRKLLSPSDVWCSIDVDSTGRYLAAVSLSALYTSSDYGNTWELKFQPLATSLYYKICSSVSISNEGQTIGIVFPNTNVVDGYESLNYYISTDGGATFLNTAGNANTNYDTITKSSSLSMSAYGRYAIFADYVSFFESFNYGIHFSETSFVNPAGSEEAIYDTAMSGDGAFVASACRTNRIFYTRNYTAGLQSSSSVVWKLVDLPGTTGLEALSIATSYSSGQFSIVSSKSPNNLFVSKNFGGNWTVVAEGQPQPVESVTIDDTGTYMHGISLLSASQGLLAVYSSFDSGITWDSSVVLTFSCGAGSYFENATSLCVPCQCGIGVPSDGNTPPGEYSDHSEYINDGSSLMCNVKCEDYPLNIASKDYKQCVPQFQYPVYSLYAPSCSGKRDTSTKSMGKLLVEYYPGRGAYYLASSSQQSVLTLLTIILLFAGALLTIFLSVTHPLYFFPLAILPTSNVAEDPKAAEERTALALSLTTTFFSHSLLPLGDSLFRILYLLHIVIYNHSLFVLMLFVFSFRPALLLLMDMYRWRAEVHLYFLHVPHYFFTKEAYDNGVKAIISICAIVWVFCVNSPWMIVCLAPMMVASQLHLMSVHWFHSMWYRIWTNCDVVALQKQQLSKRLRPEVTGYDAQLQRGDMILSGLIESLPWIVLLMVNQLKMLRFQPISTIAYPSNGAWCDWIYNVVRDNAKWSTVAVLSLCFSGAMVVQALVLFVADKVLQEALWRELCGIWRRITLQDIAADDLNDEDNARPSQMFAEMRESSFVQGTSEDHLSPLLAQNDECDDAEDESERKTSEKQQERRSDSTSLLQYSTVAQYERAISLLQREVEQLESDVAARTIFQDKLDA